jgi:hypothetical protein
MISLEEQEETSQILLPEDYKPKHKEEYHVTVRVLDVATDAHNLFSLQNKKIVVQSNGIEEITVNDKIHYLVLENYIVCVVEDDHEKK